MGTQIEPSTFSMTCNGLAGASCNSTGMGTLGTAAPGAARRLRLRLRLRGLFMPIEGSSGLRGKRIDAPHR